MRSTVLVALALIVVASHGRASAQQALSPPGAPVRFPPQRDLLHALRTAPTQERESGAPVVITSAIGAIVGGGVGYLLDRRGEMGRAAGLTSGAALGGMLGAKVGRLNPSPLTTAAGTLLAATPLLFMAAEGDAQMSLLVIPASVLPVVGAWLGNKLGQ